MKIIILKDVLDVLSANLQQRDFSQPCPIKLTTLFSEYLQDGRLLLQDINFSLWGPFLSYLNFSNCDLKNCCFDYLTITHCSFENTTIENCSFTNSVIRSCPIRNTQFDIDYEAFSKKAIEKKPTLFFMGKIASAKEKWAIFMWQKPEYFSYAWHVKNNLSNNEFVQNRNGFIFFSHPDAIDRQCYGWKLHISVPTQDVERAFDLSAPIIAQYVKKFKVVSPWVKKNAEQETSHKRHTHTLDTAQMTLYLEFKQKPTIAVDDVKRMMEKVTCVFEANHIQPGSKPDADAETISPYFSLRNDTILVYSPSNNFRGKMKYIKNKEAGSQANPGNFHNPFEAILKETSAPFNLSAFFKTFPPLYSGLALMCTLTAFLRKHTNISAISDTDRSILFEQCRLQGKYFSPFFKINEESNMNKEDKEDKEGVNPDSILKSILILLWQRKHSEFQSMEPPFAKNYFKEDHFRDFLRHIDACTMPVVSQSPSAEKESRSASSDVCATHC